MTAQLDKEVVRRRIAWRVAQEMRDGDIVNLGIGLPTLVANEVDKDVELLLQAENGLIGIDKLASEAEIDPDLVNAGGQNITAIAGSCYFNSADSLPSFAVVTWIQPCSEHCKWMNVAILPTGSFRAKWCLEWAAQWILWSAQRKLLSPWNTR